MTSTEYQQLVEFLGRQFTEIDQRFDEMGGQLAELRREMLGHFDETYRRFERLEQNTTRSRRPCAGSRRASPTGVGGDRSSSATSPS